MILYRKKHPKLYAVFAFRYDANLIPDLLENLSGVIDGYVSHDDRDNKNQWYHEGEVRNSLIKKARKAGADWVLCIDPDERLEKMQKRKFVDSSTLMKKSFMASTFANYGHRYNIDLMVSGMIK